MKLSHKSPLILTTSKENSIKFIHSDHTLIPCRDPWSLRLPQSAAANRKWGKEQTTPAAFSNGLDEPSDLLT